MRDEQLAGLTALLSVVEKKSFTAAAAALRVTPSAISQAVRGLEERTGVRLVQRTTRTVGLTEAGARFVARVRPAMDQVQEAFDALGDLRDRPAGVLRLTVPRLAYLRVLAPRLPSFLAAYPDIRLDVSIDDAFTDLVAHGFDAGIRIGEMLEREMVAVRVGPDWSMAVVGSPAYFARYGRPSHPRELETHDCIGYRRRTSGIVYRWEFSEHGKDFAVTVDGRVLLNDGDLMVQAARDGLGLAYVPEEHVRDELANGALVRVLAPFCDPFPGFFLYYPSRAQIAPKLQALVDFYRFPARQKAATRKVRSTVRAPSTGRPRSPAR